MEATLQAFYDMGFTAGVACVSNTSQSNDAVERDSIERKPGVNNEYTKDAALDFMDETFECVQPSPEAFESPAVDTPKASRTPAVVVFDTETTGLHDPLVVQLAYAVYADDGTRLSLHDHIFRLPRGRNVSWAAFKIHKIGHSIIAKRGVDAWKYLQQFATLCTDVRASGGTLVAHNAAFDVRVLQNTARTHGKLLNKTTDKIELLLKNLPTVKSCTCTMQRSRDNAGCLSKNGRRKAPTNSELYFRFFSKLPQDDAESLGGGKLHDAAFDIAVTARSYFEGRRRHWWA